MKHCLPIVLAVLTLAIGAPASAQYMYFDVNGDGVNTTADVLIASTTSVDIYLASDKSFSIPGDINSALVDATCQAGPYPLDINSYSLIITAPSGGVTYGAWTDAMGFSFALPSGQAGNDDWLGNANLSVYTPAGTHKLGTLAITVTGTPTLTLAVSSTIDATANTMFGSHCVGANFDNTMYLGTDWFSVGPTRAPTPVTETTWGKIKNLYR